MPPRITTFDNPGLNQRQTYTVTMVARQPVDSITTGDGSPFFAVPGNAGPRTMDYQALFNPGTYHLPSGIAVFAGTTDDAFWIDLGGAFDTANFRTLGSACSGRADRGRGRGGRRTSRATLSRATPSTPSRSRCPSAC